jgi:hypothetical protein
MIIDHVWIAPAAVIVAALLQMTNQWGVAIYNAKKATTMAQNEKPEQNPVKTNMKFPWFLLLLCAGLSVLLSVSLLGLLSATAPLSRMDVFNIALDTVLLAGLILSFIAVLGSWVGLRKVRGRNAEQIGCR